MNKPFPLLWIGIVLLVLLPSTASRFFLDIAGSLVLLIFLLPIILTGLGWIGWKLLQSRLNQCKNCGTTFFNDLSTCPICGGKVSTKRDGSQNKDSNFIPASSVTIDIVPEEKELDN